MLAIKVEYLTGVCFATRHDDPSRSTPEWPPHPDRLFSALVAAAADLSGPVQGLSKTPEVALQWLSECGAPELSVSTAIRRVTPDVHMPVNPHPDEIPTGDLETGDEKTRHKKRKAVLGLLPVHRKKAALAIPAVVPDSPAAYFIWPDADPGRHLAELEAICQRVTYLGRSRSLVHVSISEHAPPATHVPDSMGQIQLRVAGGDRLAYLVSKYSRDGGKPAPCPPVRYRTTRWQAPAEELMHTIFDRCWIFKPQAGDPPLPAISTLKATRALRKALIACIEDDQRRRGLEAKVPDIVHGHGKHPHCAYAALPFVHPWQRHADGSIKGIAVLVPQDVDSDVLLTLAGGLMRLQENGLGIPGIGTWRVQEVPADDPPNATLDPHTWTHAARVWTTATPMVFGHYPKPKRGGEATVVLESLAMIGIEPDRVVEMAVGRHSPLHGASPSWCFKTARERSGADHPSAWVRHVTVRFEQPVCGPILLGSMRYFGLGLMRPLEE